MNGAGNGRLGRGEGGRCGNGEFGIGTGLPEEGRFLGEPCVGVDEGSRAGSLEKGTIPLPPTDPLGKPPVGKRPGIPPGGKATGGLTGIADGGRATGIELGLILSWNCSRADVYGKLPNFLLSPPSCLQWNGSAADYAPGRRGHSSDEEWRRLTHPFGITSALDRSGVCVQIIHDGACPDN